MKKYELKVEHDDDPMNPRREWDNLGTMVCFHKRYDLGDKTDYRSQDFDSWEELEEGILENEGEVVMLPLYLYDHSGITISTSPFGCNWDSGKVGIIFVSKHKINKEGIDGSKVLEYLENEVKTYDSYLRGEVYQYRVYEIETCSLGHEHRTLVESCGGYFDEEHCQEEGKSVLDSLLELVPS
jgi:hypothetical protein